MQNSHVLVGFFSLWQLMMAFWTASLTALLLHPSLPLSLILLSPFPCLGCPSPLLQLQLGAHFSFNQRGFYCKIRFVSKSLRSLLPPLAPPLFPLQPCCFCSVRVLPPLSICGSIHVVAHGSAIAYIVKIP